MSGQAQPRAPASISPWLTDDEWRLMERLSRQLPDLLFQYHRATDGRTRFTYASEGLRSIYELEPEQLQFDSQAARDRIHPEDLGAVLAAIEHSANELTPWRQQYRVRLPQRGLRWLDGHAAPERLADGSVLWVGSIRDITTIRSATQVGRDKAASERANVAKSAFLARVSHELRTPLNAVLGFTQLMQAESHLPQRVLQYLQHIRKAGEHVLDLVNDFLDLAQIEQGRLALRPADIDLHVLLQECSDMLAPLAGARHVSLLPVQGDLGTRVWADLRALRQIVLNLLSNAIKYNRERGRVWIEIGAHDQDLVLAICDEGAGLNAEQRSRLFTPFDRLGAEHTGTPGSGLGLHISKQLAQAMGGLLEVHGSAHGGCRLELRLPLATRP